ncbi:MAG: hypothetical protein IV094_06580 [Vitreoscilla sp.]|nr:hypothetical protein [Vitreoscilla sp.]
MSHPSFLEVKGSASRHCVVVFSSFALRDYGPGAFSFRHFFEPHSNSADLLFIKDWKNQWYNRSLRGLGDSYEEVASALRARLEGYESVSTFGSSMGGYAALMFGDEIGARRVIAASPQTFLKQPYPRYKPKIHSGEYIDLRQRCFATVTDIDIFIGEECLFDIYQCLPFMDMPNVHLHFVPDTFHVPVEHWGRVGILTRLATSLCTQNADGYIDKLSNSYACSKVARGLRQPLLCSQITDAVEGYFLQQYGRAVDALRRIVDMEPDWLGPRALLGQSLLRSGDEAGASAEFKLVFQNNVCIDDFHADYAMLLARSGDAQAAIDVAKQAVRLNASNSSIFATLESLFGEMGLAAGVAACKPYTSPPAPPAA